MRYAILFCLAMVVGCGGEPFWQTTIDGINDGGAEAASPHEDATTSKDAATSDDTPTSSDAVTIADARTDTPSTADIEPPRDTSAPPADVEPPRDVAPDKNSPPVDAGELADIRSEPPPDSPDAYPPCDLKACQGKTDAGDIICNGYVALCCNGPCPPGFEGMTCYCGQCRFPTHYNPDAGTCDL